MSLWTSTYADWDHEMARLEIDTSELVEVRQAELEAALGDLADQLRPFQVPPGCTGCGGCRSCLVILP